MFRLLPASLLVLGGCGLLDAATSDKPNSRQVEGIGDAFVAMAAFGTVIDDPAGADTGDLADMHATEPYKQILDPDNTVAVEARTVTDRRPLTDCTTHDGNSASWNCSLTFNGNECNATGSGTKNGDGSYSGSSTISCTTAGLPTIRVSAANAIYDEEAGMGGGTLTVEVGHPNFGGWATFAVNGVELCTEDASPKPKAGTLVIDGQGPLDGLPFDTLTIEASDDPVCGTLLIRD